MCIKNSYFPIHNITIVDNQVVMILSTNRVQIDHKKANYRCKGCKMD